MQTKEENNLSIFSNTANIHSLVRVKKFMDNFGKGVNPESDYSISFNARNGLVQLEFLDDNVPHRPIYFNDYEIMDYGCTPCNLSSEIYYYEETAPISQSSKVFIESVADMLDKQDKYEERDNYLREAEQYYTDRAEESVKLLSKTYTGVTIRNQIKLIQSFFIDLQSKYIIEK